MLNDFFINIIRDFEFYIQNVYTKHMYYYLPDLPTFSISSTSVESQPRVKHLQLIAINLMKANHKLPIRFI